eukprot:GHVT01045805.1.p1 GENE.GHVT01045805.1~~GHVT01045805.1.p1  ORF type:complete len:298 (+),score=49.02 GHVT01045805.1:1787-2680(+)
MNVMRRQARQMAAFECMHTSNMQLKQTVKQLMQYVHQTTGQHDEHPLRTQKNKNKVNPHSAVQDDFLEENVRRSDKTATLPSRTACCGAASFPPGATAAAESQPFCHRTAGCCSHYSHPGSGPHSGPNCSTALAAPLARSLPGHSASNPSFALQVDAFAVHAVEWKICGISEVLRAVSSGAPGAATMSSPRFCIPKTNIRDVVVDFHPFFDHKATNEQSHRCAIIIRPPSVPSFQCCLQVCVGRRRRWPAQVVFSASSPSYKSEFSSSELAAAIDSLQDTLQISVHFISLKEDTRVG